MSLHTHYPHNVRIQPRPKQGLDNFFPRPRQRPRTPPAGFKAPRGRGQSHLLEDSISGVPTFQALCIAPLNFNLEDWQ